MPHLNLGEFNLYWQEDGNREGAPVVFSNSLGTDLSIWDAVIERLPQDLRIVRYDMRGHGRSDVPQPPYAMGALIRDVEQLLDHLEIRDSLFVGLSIGGMIAQGLAVKRMDQVRAIVLSNTAAKIGTPDMWASRIEAVQEGGLEAISVAVMERWFSKPFRESDAIAPWRSLFLRTPAPGYVGCSAAISGTDFMTSTSGLRLPACAIAGSEDGSTPPDLVRETADLIPGSQFHLMRGVGHLPCVEAPEGYAEILTRFMDDTGHRVQD